MDHPLDLAHALQYSLKIDRAVFHNHARSIRGSAHYYSRDRNCRVNYLRVRSDQGNTVYICH